ncbi:MAG: MarR family transcriptional regulator [Alphaproteobacteria bacterium]|nr:MAG: MarR family transcriptional regulator [Alphaproteobacteria bacterium]
MPDLSSRQLALLLNVYLLDKPHTVRQLAKDLNVSKPAISRALDRLGALGFVRRRRDEHDRRSVLVQRTMKGFQYLTDFSQMVEDAEQTTRTAPPITLEWLRGIAEHDEAESRRAAAA